jgi:hypothetical protein
MAGCSEMAGATVIDGDGVAGSMASELPGRARAARRARAAALHGGGERSRGHVGARVARSGGGARGLQPQRCGVAATALWGGW